MTMEEATVRLLPDWREAIGLESAMQELGGMMDTPYMHPVVLLHGFEGVGKRHLAQWMAAKLLCAHKNACGSCGPCREVLAGIHPDVLVIDDPEETAIKTQALERLQTNLSLLSAEGMRIAVIPNCDRMTPEAANRMLKTLEEPPEQVRIIMTTSRPHALLPTVLGRCLQWRLKAPRFEIVLPWFREQLKQHARIVESDEDLGRWIRKYGCSPGVLQRQLEDKEDRMATISDRVRTLLTARQPGEVLRCAEDLARGHQVKISELLTAQEWELNQAYRSGVSVGSTAVIARRRALLGKLRSMAVFGKIHVNAQLAAESVGLLPFVDDVGDKEWRM